MTINAARREAICLAITATASLLPTNVRRDSLSGLLVCASTALLAEKLGDVEKELDHIIPSGTPVIIEGRTFEGYTKTAIQAAVVVATIPQLDTMLPDDDATDVAVDADIVATFSKDIFAGTGVISLHAAADDSLFDAWNMETDAGAAAGQFEIVDDELTLHLSGDLDFEAAYYILWTSGVVVDNLAQPVPALTDITAWSFTVVAEV